MRYQPILLIVLFFLTSSSSERYPLSDKQKADGWYLEQVDDNIVKVMHPLYGYLKHVRIADNEINLSKAEGIPIQIIDLIDMDTSLYSNLYKNEGYFPAGGSIGYPVQASDYNHNGLIDFSGAYKLVQDYKINNACVVEFTNDSYFILKKIYGDSLTAPLPVSDLNMDGFMEMNFRRNKKFTQLRSTLPGFFPDSISFTYLMWSGGGGAVGAESLTDLDKDGKMDLLYVGDDSLEPPARQKIYVAEYNKVIDNFEQKYRYYAEDWQTYGFSYCDFDNDGYTEFVTGSIHGHVYIFENSGDDIYGMIFEDTLSTSNAYLTVATNDIDRNGMPEFFVGGSSYFSGTGGTRFYWFEADGNNTYRKVRSFLLLGVDPLSWDEIHTFDANNDGYDDILINYTYSVVILTWDRVKEEFVVFYLSKWDHPVHGVTMYDLDKDGRLDLFISVLENENVPALRTYYYKNQIITSIKSLDNAIPTNFKIEPNFPNPFNSSTIIPFTLKIPSKIDLIIYNIRGQEVRTLIKDQTYHTGRYEINWAGIDNNGNEVGSGIYICKLSDGKQTISGKMLLVK